jgi:hypothetical protein
MTQSTYLPSGDRLSSSSLSPSSTTLLEETKILFNHQGSDSELMKQIAIAIQTVNALNEKRVA